jgi:ribonuclease P protein subunit RPR2
MRRIPAPPTLDEGAPSGASLIVKPTNPDPTGVSAMDITTEAVSTIDNLESTGGRTKLRKTTTPRRPPLFIRDVGHVVFCGNERLDDIGVEGGDGLYIA